MKCLLFLMLTVGVWGQQMAVIQGFDGWKMTYDTVWIDSAKYNPPSVIHTLPIIRDTFVFKPHMPMMPNYRNPQPKSEITLDMTDLIAESIVELYGKYERECYADSSASYYYKMCDGIDCWCVPCDSGSTNFIGHKCPAHWSHRKPTLIGFMGWLKKQYGGNK